MEEIPIPRPSLFEESRRPISSFNLSYGSITLEHSNDSGLSWVTYFDSSKTAQTKYFTSSDMLHIIQSNNTTTTPNVILVKADITANIMLDGINIQSTKGNALLSKQNNNLSVTLVGKNTISCSNSSGSSAICQYDGSSISITSYSTGSLIAKGSPNHAGIEQYTSSFTINGGLVFANSDSSSSTSGILLADSKRTGTLIVNGGTLIASGSAYGINTSVCKINGGSVKSTISKRPTNNGNANLYLTTISNASITSATRISYSVNGGDQVTCTTADDGTLYLWLPVTATSVVTTVDGVHYKAQGTVTTVSDKATVSPESDAAQDFTSPVTYTVTAENGSTQTYTVIVNVAENSDKTLVSVTAPTTITGLTNGTAKTAFALGLPSR